MANKHYKQLVEFLLGPAGYTLDRTNGHGYEVYKKPSLDHRLGIIKISNRISDRDAMNFIHNVSRELGLETPKDPKKRNAQQVRERRAKEREAIQAQIDASKRELADLVAKREEEYQYRIALRDERNAQLDGVAVHLTDAQVTDISTRIREKEEAILAWQKLLAMPTAHQGRNRYIA